MMVFNIEADHISRHRSSYRTSEIANLPATSAPQLSLHRWILTQNYTGRDTFELSCYPRYRLPGWKSDQ